MGMGINSSVVLTAALPYSGVTALPARKTGDAHRELIYVIRTADIEGTERRSAKGFCAKPAFWQRA